MPIYRTTLVNFTVFERAEFEFSRGINVLIGKNGTGKSHVLKALYGMVEGNRRSFSDIALLPGVDKKTLALIAQKKKVLEKSGEEQDDELKRLVRGTLFLMFLHALYIPDNREQVRKELKKLMRRGGPEENSPKSTAIVCGFSKEQKRDSVVLNINIEKEKWVSLVIRPYTDECPHFLTSRSVFLPPREALSFYPGFIPLYQQRWLAFDRTYYELCEALSVPPLREPSEQFSSIIATLEAAIGGRVSLHGDRFVIEQENGEIDANLEAEGLRKLAMIAHLIANGSLEPGGYLFWDEPEANMNPKLVVLIKDLLVGLAKAGVQVFIATHDYLLCSELSLFSEYASPEDKDLVKFFCLNKEKHTDPVTVESGAVLADLSHNPIVEEFSAHYEREAKLFAGKQ
jgi:ABC-type multidrug transport system ATPase subunit